MGSLGGGQLRFGVRHGLFGLLVFDGFLAGLGQELDAHISALLGPFVGLFGQDRTDKAADRSPVGEDSAG